MYPAEIQGCGGVFGEDTGVIKSPRWPHSYPASRECMWVLEAPPGRNISLTFTHFDLEAKDLLSSRCLDSLVAYDVLDASLIKHGEKLTSPTI